MNNNKSTINLLGNLEFLNKNVVNKSNGTRWKTLLTQVGSFSFFFPVSVFKAFFLLANFTMSFLGQWFDFIQWQASMLAGSISASHSRKMSQTSLSRSLWEMPSGMPEISRHSFLEYYSFAQRFLSTLVSWLNNSALICLLLPRSDFSFTNLFCRSVSSLLIFVSVASNPFLLKIHQCRSENLPTSSSSYENNIQKISH